MASRKLPANVLNVDEDNNVIELPFASFVTSVIKTLKVKPIKDEDGNITRSAEDVVKLLFLAHLNDDEGVFELPEGMESYASISEQIKEYVTNHVSSSENKKAEIEAEKERKAQERELAKEAKEKEAKQIAEYQLQFEAKLVESAAKAAEKSKSDFTSVLGSIKLPKTIGLSSNSSGVVFSEGVTKDDLAVATAAIVGGLDGVTAAKTSLQFVLGDLVNKSIEAKVFRSKSEAQNQIRGVILEKVNRKFDPGTINYYSVMAERVPVEKRRSDIAPGVYLTASKIVAPKGVTPEAVTKFEAHREEVIDKIASGEYTTISDVQNDVKQFKTKLGLLGPATIGTDKLLKNLFWSIWIKRNMTQNEDGSYNFIVEGKPSTVSVADITAVEEQSLNELQNIFVKKADLVIAGEKTVKKEDKEVSEPYLIDLPFYKESDGK